MLLTLDDFDYKLPGDLIAQHPPAERGASRLLHLAGARLRDLMFTGLPAQLRAGDLLIFNDTRVIKARLHGEKSSGGKIEVLIERVLGEREALAQIRASKSPRAGAQLRLNPDIRAEVTKRVDDLYHLRFADGESILTLLDRHGAVPLPPYVAHAPDAGDEARYQTVYARNPGAVAAPTAGLHFDAAMLERLRTAGVELAWITLHVGAGTFQPVRHNDLAQHRMHSEWFSVPTQTRQAILAARARGRSVVAVGTTSMRALESAARVNDNGSVEINAGESETRLFILPGYQFRIVDRLITNFHLPRSTLLMLVSAFGGMDNIRRAYAHAVEARYRFFSYGDAMLIDRMRP